MHISEKIGLKHLNSTFNNMSKKLLIKT